MKHPVAFWRRGVAASCAALMLGVAPTALAQVGGTPSNAVALWGQDSNTGLPCIISPAPSGSTTCKLPTPSSSGGGAVTGAAGSFVDGWSVTDGSTTDTVCASDAATCSEIALLKRNNARLSSLITAIGTPFQAGGSIGNASFGATQATASNLNATVVGTGTFATQATLQAGSNIAGKFGIDQTTPGTTNGVQVNAALPAGSNVIGGVTPTGADVTVTPTIQNAAYASGNCMGGFQTVALGSVQSVLSQITLASQGTLATAKQLYVFSANPSGSTCTDKSTFTIATADLSKLIWTGSITPAAPTGTTKTWGNAGGLALGIPAGGTVYVAIVETTTETPATTTDLVLTLSAF